MTTTSNLYSILIADDDRASRETLQDIIEPEGYNTILASCGEEALEIVHGEAVHLALFDMHMPRMTGLETIEQIRQVNALLPCILVTADANEGLIRQAFQVRVVSVLPKPVSKNVVIHTVVRTLTRVYGEDLPGNIDEFSDEE